MKIVEVVVILIRVQKSHLFNVEYLKMHFFRLTAVKTEQKFAINGVDHVKTKSLKKATLEFKNMEYVIKFSTFMNNN